MNYSTLSLAGEQARLMQTIKREQIGRMRRESAGPMSLSWAIKFPSRVYREQQVSVSRNKREGKPFPYRYIAARNGAGNRAHVRQGLA